MKRNQLTGTKIISKGAIAEVFEQLSRYDDQTQDEIETLVTINTITKKALNLIQNNLESKI